MQATLWFYIIVGLLTVVPLILFNISRVFVKKAPAPLKINWMRGVVILLICGVIILFLATAYNATLHERYEIALERAAQQHAEYLVGDSDAAVFRAFLVENGTDNIGTAFDQTNIGSSSSSATVRFQISSWCIPKYWEGKEGFEQVEVLGIENPVYVMYLLETADGTQQYFAMRMVETEDGWKYDWIGEATEQQQKTIKMPTKKNGKWYTVTA